ncbi:ATP-binding protein, partial [Porphyromonas loveana]
QGIGMSRQQIEHILEAGKSSNITTGTNGEKGSGLGLIICKGLLERNKSKLHIDSREGRGCIFSFVLTPA